MYFSRLAFQLIMLFHIIQLNFWFFLNDYDQSCFSIILHFYDFLFYEAFLIILELAHIQIINFQEFNAILVKFNDLNRQSKVYYFIMYLKFPFFVFIKIHKIMLSILFYSMNLQNLYLLIFLFDFLIFS